MADSSLPAGPAIPHPDPNTLSIEGARQNGKRAAQVIEEGLRLLQKHKDAGIYPPKRRKSSPNHTQAVGFGGGSSRDGLAQP